MFRPVTKAARLVDTAEEIGDAVLESGTAALAAPTGPVYLGIPTDLLSQPVSVAIPAARAASGSPGRLPPAAVERACELLASAERPLIWAGGGALRAGAGRASASSRCRLAAPVVTTYMGRGLLPPDHPCAVPGPVHASEVGALWDEADVVLAIGTDFDGTNTQNWQMPAPPALISINVDEADANKSYASDVTLVGDARAVVEQLLAGRRRPATGCPSSSAGWRRSAPRSSAWVENDDEQAARFLDVVHRALPPDTVVVTDMCIPGYWLGGYWQVAPAAQARLSARLGHARVRLSRPRSEPAWPAPGRPCA